MLLGEGGGAGLRSVWTTSLLAEAVNIMHEILCELTVPCTHSMNKNCQHSQRYSSCYMFVCCAMVSL